jgi:hypothetical protein
MKKLIILGFLLISASSFSQSFTQNIIGRLTFGVKAGANYSNFYNANFDTEAIPGFHAGALVNFEMSKHFSIEEDFLFSSQGAKTKQNLFGNQTIKMYYMSVPILLKYSMTSGFYIESGMQASVLLKDVDAPLADGKFAQKVDMGVATGLGYQTKAGLGFGVRYIAGLSKVGDFKSSAINTDFRNSVGQASVSYTLKNRSERP